MNEHELSETYFAWLGLEAFSNDSLRDRYEGVLRTLHDIPFYWTLWGDENRAGDAITYRQYEFLSPNERLFGNSITQEWLEATPSILEVFLGIAHRWNAYFEGSPESYFWIMFCNMQFDKYSGKTLASTTQNRIRERVDNWLARQFTFNGLGSPFPVEASVISGSALKPMNEMEIWEQMNVYSAVHFQ